MEEAEKSVRCVKVFNFWTGGFINVYRTFYYKEVYQKVDFSENMILHVLGKITHSGFRTDSFEKNE